MKDYITYIDSITYAQKMFGRTIYNQLIELNSNFDKDKNFNNNIKFGCKTSLRSKFCFIGKIHTGKFCSF